MSKATIVLEDEGGLVSVTSTLEGQDSKALELASQLLIMVDRMADKIAGQKLATPQKQLVIARH